MSGRSISSTRDHLNQLSHGELMNPNHKVDSDPMLPNIRTSLHTTFMKPDPTPSTDPDLFDKSTGHPNSHYDHSKTLSKKKRAKMYGTGSPQQTQRQATMKVDRTIAFDDHDAHEKVDHNKARDEYQEAWDHNIDKSKDATISGREDEDLMTKRDEVSKADKPDEAQQDKSVTTSDANKKKFADRQKQTKSSAKSSNKSSNKSSDKSSDKSSGKPSSDKSDEPSEVSDRGLLGRAAERASNLASGMLDAVKDKVSNLAGKSEESSDNRQQSAKEQTA